jgi:hypothetical protein
MTPPPLALRMRVTTLVAAGAFSACAPSSPVVRAQAEPVALDVQFKLTDLDDSPIPNAPVRIAFGPANTWQAPDSGTRFVTDAAGEYRFTTSAVLDAQPKAMPTNFADSMTARAQPTDHLLVATELPYMTFRWLYTVDLWRFRNGGDVLTGGLAVYTRDDAGRFTQQARRKDGGWLMADLKGLALTTPGHDPWDFRLEPAVLESKPPRWTLRLAFKRSPPPVRR